MYWQEWEDIGNWSRHAGDTDIVRDDAGEFHIIYYDPKLRIYCDREVTPQQAAALCLENLIPEELQPFFEVKGAK